MGEDFNKLLAETRKALGNSAESQLVLPSVLSRSTGEPVVAFLVTASTTPLVIPLCAEISFVGKSSAHTQHDGWPSPSPVEGAQWFFRCSDSVAEVADASSTNQSVLIRRGTTVPPPCSLIAAAKLARHGVHGIEAIVHQPPVNFSQLKWTRINEGDTLVTVYASMLFGWLKTLR